MKHFHITTTRMIVFGFLPVILVGAVLLMLPMCSQNGTPTSFSDTLFTSTASVSITGLMLLDTGTHWNFLGQFIILVLIQCGGLGIITMTTYAMVLAGRKVSLKDRLLLQDSFNLNTMSGLVEFLLNIMKGTFIVEGIGTVCYMFTFVPEYGGKGVWFSVFMAVSAFCNAGIDVLGSQSLDTYAGNPWINVVTMLLVIVGGIGFIVWWDIIGAIKKAYNNEIYRGRIFKSLSLHSKVVLVSSAILIAGGALLIFIIEYNNPETIGNFSIPKKIMASFFQSVTSRSSGFYTISQKGLRDASAMISMALMFVGGSSVGTAGGVKTTTVAVLFITAMCVVRGSEEISAFKRRIPLGTIRKALSVVLFSFIALLVVICLLSVVNGGDFMDVSYEAAAAITTSGLSRGYTDNLNQAGRIIVMICMYIGRVGPISMAIAFSESGRKKPMIVYAEEDVTVG